MINNPLSSSNSFVHLLLSDSKDTSDSETANYVSQQEAHLMNGYNEQAISCFKFWSY
jgi:hypothetical protein